MAYCTQSDIEKQLDSETLIQLTDDAGNGSVDTDVVDRAIADADEEIDSALAIRYSMPFDTTPNLVRKISVDLSICNLFARKDDTMPEQRQKRCDEARDLLDQLAQGKRVLDVPDPAEDDNAGVSVTTDKDDRIFSMGKSSNGSTGSLDSY